MTKRICKGLDGGVGRQPGKCDCAEELGNLVADGLPIRWLGRKPLVGTDPLSSKPSSTREREVITRNEEWLNEDLDTESI